MSARTACFLLAAWFLTTGETRAGMAAPVPADQELQQVLRLNGTVVERLQAISFFLLALCLCAAAVRLLWNYLQRDFAALPRLTFARALVGVVLWGLLFILVLAMIGGARELMTPGAWQKQGFTYRLSDGPPPAEAPSPQTQRRQHLERLRTALWQFAATHQGRFPTSAEVTAIPDELWEVPESAGLHYHYVPGLSAGHAPVVLVREPELDAGQRLVLYTNGDILSRRSPQGGRR